MHEPVKPVTVEKMSLMQSAPNKSAAVTYQPIIFLKLVHLFQYIFPGIEIRQTAP